MSKFNKDMTIGEVLRIDMNAASVLMECTALAVLLLRVRHWKRLLWCMGFRSRI